MHLDTTELTDFQDDRFSFYSMSEIYPCKECPETFSKAFKFRNQQKTHSGEKPYPCTVCHRHIPVKNVERHFLKHVDWCEELSLKGARCRRAQLYVRNRSKWNNFYTFILKNITQQINPDCFLPLSGEFLTKKYISHLSKLVTMSSGKIV